MGNLPAFNADYILTYLSSVYGTITAILLCCVLAVLIFAVFNTAMRQKNQLGMMMGCGCGIVFLINFSINMNLTIDQAMNALEVPADKREKYRKTITPDN